ncbi:MAG: mechanosensitive ion channel domain-containing protein [Patescibacteria group bacterium]
MPNIDLLKTAEILALVLIVSCAVMVLHALIARAFRASRAFKNMSALIEVVLWSLGALFLLSNLGVNVTSIVAGLGIGGIAIAFALQNILSDLFSSFAIQLDKPFEVGDSITVGQHKGIVEKIGIKTTRLRSESGEEIIVPNKDLVSSIVVNRSK